MPWPVLPASGRRGVKREVRLEGERLVGEEEEEEAMRALVVGWEGPEPLARRAAAVSAVRMKGIMRFLTASMS